MAIAVSPINENEVYFGTTKVIGTVDHTTTVFSEKSPYSGNGFHADVHTLVFSPDTSSPYLYCGHDGGISKKNTVSTGTGGWQYAMEGKL